MNNRFSSLVHAKTKDALPVLKKKPSNSGVGMAAAKSSGAAATTSPKNQTHARPTKSSMEMIALTISKDAPAPTVARSIEEVKQQRAKEKAAAKVTSPKNKAPKEEAHAEEEAPAAVEEVAAVVPEVAPAAPVVPAEPPITMEEFKRRREEASVSLVRQVRKADTAAKSLEVMKSDSKDKYLVLEKPQQAAPAKPAAKKSAAVDAQAAKRKIGKPKGAVKADLISYVEPQREGGRGRGEGRGRGDGRGGRGRGEGRGGRGRGRHADPVAHDLAVAGEEHHQEAHADQAAAEPAPQ